MGGEWERYKIDDIFYLENGYAFKGKEFVAEGIPVIKIKNIKAGYFSSHDFSYVDPEYVESKPTKVAQANDILISMSGNRHDGSPETWVGKVALFNRNRPHLINQRVGALRVRDTKRFNSRYLAYVLSSWDFQRLFISIATSSGGQANLSPKQILQEKVLCPSEPTQSAIAHILGTLDDKIELNRQTNETLEAMAQALFKSWFVDFDPVIDNALAAGNDIPEPFKARAAARQALGDVRKPLPEEIRREFPDGFEFRDEMGWVPRGWDFGRLDAHAEVIMGHSPKGDSYNIEGIGVPLVNGPVEFGSYFTERVKWTTEPTRMSKAGDLVICVRGSTTGRYVRSDGEYCLGRGVCALRAHQSQIFVDSLFNYSLEKFLVFATGSTFPSWSGPTIRSFRSIIPAVEVVAAFENIAGENLKKQAALSAQSDSCMEVRDTLLPKLLSGQLTIPYAEKLVSATT